MRYSAREVRGLVSSYLALREAKGVSGHGLHLLIVLTDLERAISKMPPREYHVLLVHGLLQYSSRDAGLILGISHITVQDRYATAISWLVSNLNEGVE